MAFRLSTLLLVGFAAALLLGVPVAPEWAIVAARSAARLLGAWTAVSFASLLVIVPVFRAQASANEVEARRRRRLDWAEAAVPSSLAARA